MTPCVLPAFWETNNDMWSVKTRTLPTEDLVLLLGQCNLGLPVFYISVSLISQKIPQNCGYTCGQLHVAHSFSQLSLGFPYLWTNPVKFLQYYPVHGMCLGHPVCLNCVNIINSKLDELSTLANCRTSLKCLHLIVGAAESLLLWLLYWKILNQSGNYVV